MEPSKEAIKLLESPCAWCGYDGDNYWQMGSHPKECPWSDVGGERTRLALLRPKITAFQAEIERLKAEIESRRAFVEQTWKDKCELLQAELAEAEELLKGAAVILREQDFNHLAFKIGLFIGRKDTP